MNAKTFDLTMILAIVAMAFIAIVLGALTEFMPPQVQSVELAGTPESANYTDQSFQLSFNRPMDQQSVNQNIVMEPETDFSTYWQNNQLTISVQDVLIPDSEYKLSIQSTAQDIYGNQLGNIFEYKFTTKPRYLAYIDRGEGDQPDKIVVTDSNFESSQEVFSTPDIKFYAIDFNYIIAVAKNDNGTEFIHVLDFSGQEIVKIDVPDVRYSDFDYDADQHRIIFSRQPVEVTNGVVIPTSGHTIYIYDIQTQQETELKVPFMVGDFISTTFTDDGKGVVFRDSQGSYYLIDPADTDNYISFGKHISISNFSSRGDKVIFLDQPIGRIYSDYPTVQLLDNERVQSVISPGDEFWVDMQFLNLSDRVIFSRLYKEVEATKGHFKLSLYDLETEAETDLLIDEKLSIELPRMSPDDRYAAIEMYTYDDLSSFDNLRSYEFQAKPYQGNIALLDMETKELVDPGIRGAEVVWLE